MSVQHYMSMRRQCHSLSLVTLLTHTHINMDGTVTPAAQYPGAEHVHPSAPPSRMMEEGLLPVAIPIDAEVVTNKPQLAYTTTSTTVTHIPAPAARTNTHDIYTPPFYRHPVLLASCPNCKVMNARTRIRTFPSIFTWIACLVMLLLFWPLCWVPLVCDVCKQTDHYCTRCNTKVGESQPFADCCEKHRG